MSGFCNCAAVLDVTSCRFFDAREFRVMMTCFGVCVGGGADIRTSSHDNSLTLTYFGVVTQTTEEDWEGVRLVRKS